MQAIIDTRFIIHNLKIDDSFIDKLEDKGYNIRIPKAVIEELKDISKDFKSNHDDKIISKKALEIFSDNKRFKRIDLGHGVFEESLIKKDSEGYFIGTMDKVVNRKITNKLIL